MTELTTDEINLIHEALSHSSHVAPCGFQDMPAGVGVLPLMAYRHRIWEPLGYNSFEEYLESEFYELGYTPKNADAENAIRYYKNYGMSPAAISIITALPQGHIEHLLTSYNGRTFTPLRPFTPTC